MSEQDKNAVEELAYIKQIMSDSKTVIIDNGVGFVFWGVLITVALTYTYLQILFKWELDNDIVWYILIGIGWLFTIVDTKRRHKKRRVSTYAGKTLGALWISSGIAMTIFGFGGTISGAYGGVYVSPIISVVLGIAFYTSGIIQRKMWVSYLAIGWWIGALYMFFFPALHTLLVMVFMMVGLQIVPGIFLYKQTKSEAA